MSRSNEDILKMAVDSLSPAIKVAALEVDTLPGQRGLFFPDAEDSDDASLVFFNLAARCGSGSDARKFERLVTFILDEARKAKVLASGQDATAALSALGV